MDASYQDDCGCTAKMRHGLISLLLFASCASQTAVTSSPTGSSRLDCRPADPSLLPVERKCVCTMKDEGPESEKVLAVLGAAPFCTADEACKQFANEAAKFIESCVSKK